MCLFMPCAVLLALLLKKLAALRAMKARRADGTGDSNREGLRVLDDKIRKTVAKTDVLLKRLNDADVYVKAQVAEAAQVQDMDARAAEILRKAVAVMQKAEAKAAAADADAANIVKKAREQANDRFLTYKKLADANAAEVIKHAKDSAAALTQEAKARAAALAKDAESMHAAVIARCSQDFEDSKTKAAALIADAESRAASIIALCSQGFNPAAAEVASAESPAAKRARV